jgi:LemA protein
LPIAISYNDIVNKKFKVDQSKSTIDVYLKKRFDLIPNLIEVVKAYDKHEKKVLEDLAKIRSNYDNSTKEIKEEESIYNSLTKVIGVVEAYPDLKSSNNYLELQKEMSSIENELQATRRIYNQEVYTYNTTIQSFPNNIIASTFKFKVANFFNFDEKEDGK